MLQQKHRETAHAAIVLGQLANEVAAASPPPARWFSALIQATHNPKRGLRHCRLLDHCSAQPPLWLWRLRCGRLLCPPVGGCNQLLRT